ncbi:Eco57I restriction-modification methylase domain-containing protein [Sedimentimonas flavescens]|uniref:Eco57I restriction-modification methylase domain-containing protein n=1 Tax=Sedimentimonas flavescens TaxID=2851012 RepID=UPI001C4A6C90|nr:Eco57I restriction-modification methylase domain-containing protein [Sedimentimonas flavescens]MBW0159493.1 Eco57I restriction-modification methylase domain-containing protein [Sedimentimonas flavescens]
MNGQVGFSFRGRNPDVLTCIANLSNDEVFTPPEFANRMLDTLAEAWAADHGGVDLWADSSVRFLDPCTKSGVFLREITRRLIDGLEREIPDLQARVDHILTRQVFGIGITQLTSLLARRSLYCSKHANGAHSIARSFTTDAGNIWFERTEHVWVGAKCRHCGAGKETHDRGERFETHAYAFIHTDDINALIAAMFGGEMQFDVIIGNPPYQLASDGGTRDVPIYQKFVEQSKKLEPRYLSMVIPSRWMAGGLGLSDFRQTMLRDKRVSQLVDYPNAAEIFPSVGINGGACYFLWDANNSGECHFTSMRAGEVHGPTLRNLDEFDVLVRDTRGLDILRKVLAWNEPSVNSILARDKEFGWTSNFDGFHQHEKDDDVPLYYIRTMKRSVGYIARSEVEKSTHLIDTWKVLVPAVGSGRERERSGVDLVLGPSLIAPAPSVCTQSYLFFFVSSEREARSLQSYYTTRFFRFMVSLRKITQHATHSTYQWVPIQSWDRIWTDDALYLKYGITTEEAEYIESLIRPMDLGDE